MSQKNFEIERLVVAVNPVVGHDLSKQTEAIESLEQYLSHTLGLPVQVGVRESYEETLLGMERGEIDAARLGQYAFALAQARFGARALVNAIDIAAADDVAPAPYRSVIITRADSGITNLVELRGAEFGFVDRNSTTGYLVPTFLLEQAGLDPAIDIQSHFLLSHQAVAEAVERGELLAGAVMQGEFLQYALKNPQPPLRVLATSPLLSRGPIAIRPGLPYQLEKRLLSALVQLHQANLPGATLIIPPTQRFTPANQREMTLKTVAELAGVSYGTVSRAINGRDRIAPATTARILRLVEELGYRPNANARSLHQARGDLVGLLLPTLNFPGLDNIINGLQETLGEAGMQLLICPVLQKETCPPQKNYFELLHNNRLEGLLLTQWSANSPEAQELAQSGRPTALLEQELLTEGLKTAWNWLREQGHTKIALVVGTDSLLEPNITRHIFSQFAEPDFQFFSETNLTKANFPEQPPVAFLCTDDNTAFRLRQALSTKTMVLGFGSSLIAQWAGIPSLTYDGEAMGKAAAQRLLKILGINGQTHKQPLKFWVEEN
jgi:phosphate/phosphite/phosphonate ABC transporter binding protein